MGAGTSKSPAGGGDSSTRWTGGFASVSISSFINEASAEAADGLHPPDSAPTDDAPADAGDSGRPPLDAEPALNADSTGPFDTG